jgi:hypothetical protein
VTLPTYFPFFSCELAVFAADECGIAAVTPPLTVVFLLSLFVFVCLIFERRTGALKRRAALSVGFPLNHPDMTRHENKGAQLKLVKSLLERDNFPPSLALSPPHLYCFFFCCVSAFAFFFLLYTYCFVCVYDGYWIRFKSSRYKRVHPPE